MKKTYLTPIFSIALILGLAATSSCGGKSSPEKEVKNYAEFFVEILSANQRDSLQNAYEDIVFADSITPLTADSISVKAENDSLFLVSFGRGVSMKVKRDSTGNMKVIESKGLFVFPPVKLEIAKKTGMWNDSLTDMQLAERLQDKGFFAQLELLAQARASQLITIDKFETTKAGTGFNKLTNNTDVDIKGSDYEIVKRYENKATKEKLTPEAFPGEDIRARGSIEVPSDVSKTMFSEVSDVHFKLSGEELYNKFSTPTGHEYDDYLNSKAFTSADSVAAIIKANLPKIEDQTKPNKKSPAKKN